MIYKRPFKLTKNIPILYIGIFLLFITSCSSEEDRAINGTVTFTFELKENDTIFLTEGDIDKKYYTTNSIQSPVKNNSVQFLQEKELDYPHMYSLNLHSEKNIRPRRDTGYFIDPTSTMIDISDANICTTINGPTHKEFIERFVPYILKDTVIDCVENNFETFIYEHQQEFNKRLGSYIIENPNSYVALWYMIHQYSVYGYFPIYQDLIKLFSDKLKASKIWVLFSDDLESIRIKKGFKFPVLELQTIDFKEEQLVLDLEAEYTLIDFWFHSCRPCIESFPKLKELYSQYTRKELDIIGISVDMTRFKEKWPPTVLKYELPWDQYLDENALEARKETIRFSPTYILVDKEGITTFKSNSVDEVEIFLKQNLKINE